VLNLIINGSTFSTSSNTINYDTWNYVFINIDLMQSSNNVNVYIDSELEGTGSIAVSPPNLSSADFYLGQGDSGQGRFFITEVALFNETKSQEFILNRYNDRNREDQDNGDRSNKFTLFIPDDADYLSGSIQIRYKDENIYNEFDGELIYENNSLLSGEIEFIHHDKFSLLETYYYRVFTNNGTNFNNINDSALLEVIIPDISQEVQETIVKQLLQPESILGVTYVAGNRKNYIKWDQSAIPSNVNQVRIYHSTKNFPSVETQGTNPISESHTGDLVFSGDARKGKFLHENINNDTTHFYSIVLSDGVFTTSESYKVSILSKSDNDETDIPIKDIDGISYELTSDGLNLIFWKSDR